eukprot:CAMPEP_0206146566 /NCGR_PEP_ID=MMETSP1473-20131121/30761_1 /ASSEMBLY_ACC=CAM_ASM_001109 /TAXON_ID=1461547 /ORGANISM="Stichococcus sp, Strain RCC1054" /LENGTH=196 /DNA_ID=CAMNT_0053543169 /DNA_START=415 /DNA_END=1001 /DNA_ORIENTATION=-
MRNELEALGGAEEGDATALSLSALRMMPRRQEAQTTPAGRSSKFRGVTLFRPTGKWRSQISLQGKTISLGEYVTQEEAAAAFDKAVLYKDGCKAKLNFPSEYYAEDMSSLTALSWAEVVAALRLGARSSQSHTSAFRGVSLLRQTGRWHAQRAQVHLGFFSTEVKAAHAYDLATLALSAPDRTAAVFTNFPRSSYR